MRIGLLSDTHGFFDEALAMHFQGCDEIWHAGDLGSGEVLDRLGAIKPVRAVFGNIDDGGIRSRLPEDLEWSSDDVRVYMTHIGGRPGRYDRRAGRELRQRRPDLFLCGHSHIAAVLRDEEMGLLYINPGAAGHSGWHVTRTAMRFEISGRRVFNLELLELGRRGRKTA